MLLLLARLGPCFPRTAGTTHVHLCQQNQALSRSVLDVNQGSLYPALQRLEQREWIDSEWRTSDNNRRAKYYRLTAKGRRALSLETDSWRRYVAAVEDILATT